MIRTITYTLEIEPTVKSLVFHVGIFKTLPGCGIGGSLHLFTDDGNMSDGELMYCCADAIKKGDEAAQKICECLLLLTPSQRREVYEQLWKRP